MYPNYYAYLVSSPGGRGVVAHPKKSGEKELALYFSHPIPIIDFLRLDFIYLTPLHVATLLLLLFLLLLLLLLLLLVSSRDRVVIFFVQK